MRRYVPLLLGSLLLAGCASLDIPADQCPTGTQALPNCPPPEAVQDGQLDAWYELREWQKPQADGENWIQRGIEAELPVQHARVKVLGTSARITERSDRHSALKSPITTSG